MPRSKTKRVLPRGPHALTREQVEKSQRERLFMAMLESVAEKGYAQTSVADVLARSGVSRATFYTLFKDKEDCFRATYEKAAGQVAEVLVSGIQSALAEPLSASAGPFEKIDWILGSYLDMLASQPALAKAFLVEVYAAGPGVIRQRQESLEAFVDLFAFALRDRQDLFGGGEAQRFALKTLVHAVSSMVTLMVGVGDTAHLPELRAPLVRLAKDLLR